MALLKVTGITYTLLNLFLMVYTQAQDKNSTATPAASTATVIASTSSAPSSTTAASSTTQLVSSSAASGGTTATLLSSSGASLNTASQPSTAPENTTTSPTLSTNITTSSTIISSNNTTSSLTVATPSPNTTSPNTTSPNSTLLTQTNTTVSPNVSTTSEHNTTVSANVTTTSEHNTTVSPNVTTTSEHNTTVSPNVTTTSEHNTTVSPNVTTTFEHNTTVSPNVTSTSQPTTTDSLNDTVTNSTDVSGTSTSSATTKSASSTTSLSSPVTPTVSPPTTTITPTIPPQGSTVVMMLTAVTAGYHPAKVNLTMDNINRWSRGLCENKTTTSVVALKITSGSDYFYHVNSITETTGAANPGDFICMVDDLPNLSTRFYGTITCSRDSQSCTSGNGAGACASVTMVTNQCSVAILWPSHQTVSIVYNPKVLSFTCREENKISCLANIDVSQVTGATSLQPPATPSSSPESPIADTVASRDGDKGHSGVILGVILSILVVAIAMGLGVVWWRQRSSKQRGSVQFHNDGSQPRTSKPVGLRIGEKRTMHRLESSNSDDTEFEFSSVNLSPTAPSPQATIDVTSGQKLHSKNDSADHNTAGGAHPKYATNDEDSGDNSQRVSHVYDLPTDDRKAH
ncbi:unnamed protein product [Lymnaea stagnalis]|uniref:Mucin-5AC-like n=1 Tax=Lymnaea stagnalis TaxID=6523 RepID=A0AAV2I1P1_LYMST